MAYEQKDGQGSLFKNKRKETERHPDYNGSITINGVEYWLSAWLKTAQSGEKYMSLALGKPKEAKAPTAPQPTRDYNDDIGF
jgi:uncharacterized protein (DUF736 family)